MAHALKGIAASAILLMPGLRIVNYKAILNFEAPSAPDKILLSVCFAPTDPTNQPSVKN